MLIGASRPEQVRQNVASLEVTLTPKQQARLEAAGTPPLLNPDFIFGLPRDRIFGGHTVKPWA